MLQPWARSAYMPVRGMMSQSMPWAFTSAVGMSVPGLVVVAAAIVLIPGAPLGLITTGVQALAGLLLPSATVFLLLLCNDRQVLGPWVNRPWLNVVAGVIVSVLLLLSGILMATTIFPKLNVVSVAVCLCVAFVICAVAAFGVLWWTGRRRPKPPVLEQLSQALARVDRESWRMPPLALLEPVQWSVGTRVGMLTLRSYLVIGAILLLVKAIQLGSG